jgi:hypothetical protein
MFSEIFHENRTSLCPNPLIQKVHFHIMLPGLPNGRFPYQKYHFEYILVDLVKENVDVLYVHSEYILSIWYTLWAIGIF